MTETYPGWRFLYSPRWLGYYAMLIIFAVGCVLLSQWQFDRRSQAQAEITRIINNYDAPPVALETALPALDSFDPDSQKWLPIITSGHYLGEAALVRNRPGANGTGSALVQAFKTTAGTIILVDRGWVSATVDSSGKADFATLPIAATETEITLVARLRASEAQVSGRSATVHSAGSINTQELAEITGVKDDPRLVTAAFVQLITETPAQRAGELAPKPALDEGPHLSYALQWIVFIAIAGVGIGYAARQEFKHFNKGSKKVADMAARAIARQQKRRDKRGLTDAEAEDAYLDSTE